MIAIFKSVGTATTKVGLCDCAAIEASVTRQKEMKLSKGEFQ
jgi:hypothetical protein